MSVTIDGPADFPALFRSADRESERAQRSYLRSLRVRLGALLVAAFGGALTLTTAGGFQVGGGLAFLAFACALGAELFLATTSPLTTWYQGRAAAESAKTLAWRYMVRAEPFEGETADVDKQFLSQTHSLLQDLQSISLSTAEPNAQQISDKMRQIRAMDFEERRKVYLADRIADQQRWYSEKARWNDRRARTWVLVSIVLEIAGLLGGALKAFGLVNFDLLGFLAAAAGSVLAWIEAKQHRNLATAYGIASQELTSIATELLTVNSEQRWAAFVAQSEEAISREHTLWRASRGLSDRFRHRPGS
jgi:SMODS and SLOG-associating 2TM effector domain 3/SMODS and SLOG-associating 2TM effector domain 1